MQAERNVGLLRQELDAVESAILKEAGPDGETGLDGMVLLYVGGRAGLVLFPVDYISYDVALNVKYPCRQDAKRFIPLRSASVTSLLAALRRPEVGMLAGAAD